jgi:hypothetical protein
VKTAGDTAGSNSNGNVSNGKRQEMDGTRAAKGWQAAGSRRLQAKPAVPAPAHRTSRRKAPAMRPNLPEISLSQLFFRELFCRAEYFAYICRLKSPKWVSVFY